MTDRRPSDRSLVEPLCQCHGEPLDANGLCEECMSDVCELADVDVNAVVTEIVASGREWATMNDDDVFAILTRHATPSTTDQESR